MRRMRRWGGVLASLPFALAPAISPLPAHAQAPPDALDDYVIFALTRIDVSSSITLTAGSIGANAGNGSISGNGSLTLDPGTGVIAAATTDLRQPSTCAAVFANAGTGDCAGAPRLAVQPPLVADPRAACGFPAQFPACDQDLDVTVGPGETLELPPGIYGDITVSDGTLTLAGGEYVVCNFTVNQSGEARATAPSTVLVVGRVNVLENSVVNPDLPPSDFRLMVNDLGANIEGAKAVLRGATCNVLRGTAARTRVRAFLCAPNQNAQLNLLNAEVEGTFLADTINTGNVTGSNRPLPPSTTTTTSTTTSTTTTTTSSTTTTTSTTTPSTTTTTTTSTTSTTTPPTSTTTTTSTTSSVTSSTATSTTTSSTTPPSSTTTTSPASTTTSSSTTGPSSTSTSSSTSTTASPSTSTSTPTSTSTTTTVPECDTLRVKSARLIRSKSNPNEGRLVVRGILAKAGWAEVDPTRSGVALSGNRAGRFPLFCCSTRGQDWTRRPQRFFALASGQDPGCPVEEAQLVIRRNGRARFTAVVPRVDLSPGAEPSVMVTVAVGDRCSQGEVPLRPVRPKPRPPAHDCN